MTKGATMNTLRKIGEKVDAFEYAMDNGNPFAAGVAIIGGAFLFWVFTVLVFSL